ncbi:MAG: hypothetical protein LCH53_05520 [Bacteroidetes bacterium]|nr:hypothetical protein [Bacteroidota bacterium]
MIRTLLTAIAAVFADAFAASHELPLFRRRNEGPVSYRRPPVPGIDKRA